MEWRGNKIILGKEINNLDKLVLDFVEILKKHADYVLVAGYVAILFGRSRMSEDIDIIIDELSQEETDDLKEELNEEGYYCLNTSDPYEYLSDDLAVRFALEGDVMPNFEIKFAKDKYDYISLEERQDVIVNGQTIYISPLELEIAYKLFLGTPKDFEDALHLYQVFKEKLNINKLRNYCKELEVDLDELREA